MTTYTATNPEGKEYTRKSERTYTHVVFSHEIDGHWVAECCGNELLAAKMAAGNAVKRPFGTRQVAKLRSHGVIIKASENKIMYDKVIVTPLKTS